MSLKIELNNGVYMVYENPLDNNGWHLVRIYGLYDPTNVYEATTMLITCFGDREFRRVCVSSDIGCSIWEITDMSGQTEFADLKG